MTKTMTTLRIEELTLQSAGLMRVAGVSADVLPGQLVAIVGANGSGKSSLLDLMAGIIQPTAGRIFINEHPLVTYSAARLARARAWLGQSTPGAQDYSVREVIAWGGRTNDAPLSSLAVENLAEALGLSDLLTAPLRRLSGGERQRTHVARIWLQDAPMTMLDEPDASLDEQGRELLHRLIDQKRDRGHAVVIVTHDREWATAAADHVWVMDRGVLTAQ